MTLGRRRSRASRSGDEPANNKVLIITGTVRSPAESEPLAVKLTISNDEVSMEADGTELGRWQLAAVIIRSIDSTSFEFIAEGDLLILTPDDAEPLRDHPLVAPSTTESGGRNRRWSLKKPSDPEIENAVVERPNVEETPSTDSHDDDSKVPEASGQQRTGVWIRSLDAARRRDMFGLDRVPIDEGLRGREHDHTWAHRVATASGIGSRVCTICGRVRLRAR